MQLIRLRSLPVLLAFVVCALMGPVRGAESPYEGSAPNPPSCKIDQLVFAQLKANHIAPATLCSDSVFIRRVYLDVIGSLPTGAQTRDFLASRNPDKRSVLINQLLERDEFADYWTLKWGDLLRVKAEFPINLWPNAAQAYHGWIRDCIRENKPYDHFVRDMLTASGSNFEYPPVNFYRALQNKTPDGMAQAVALTFMGCRTENWPTNQLAALSKFFANVSYKYTGEWKEEIVYFNPASTNTGSLNNSDRVTTFPDGTPVKLSPDRDPRAVFTDWLTAKDNRWFARNFVNRAWSWFLGRGIIEAPDDIRPDNPASNPELLKYLEAEFTDSDYDMKHIFRIILNSQTYQLSALPNNSVNHHPADFAAYPLRRLDAEVLADAIDQLTGSTEGYSSAIPEPYTFIPDNLRSIALPDGSITSSFLELFGKPPRDTGQESERNNQISAAQKLWLLNSSQFQHKIEQSRMIEYQSQPDKSPAEVVSNLYLGILSRYPTPGEQSVAQAVLKNTNRRQGVVDLAWALFNSSEFLYRH